MTRIGAPSELDMVNRFLVSAGRDEQLRVAVMCAGACHVDRQSAPVPSLGDGFDEAPLAGPIQRTAQFADRLVDRPIEFDEDTIGPPDEGC